MDNVVVDGLKTDYRNEISSIPGVRKYMLEHLQNLDKTLLAIELSGATILGAKS